MDFLRDSVNRFKATADEVVDDAKDSTAWKKMEEITDDIKDTDAYRKLEAIKQEKLRELKEFEEAQKRRLAELVYQKLDGVFEHGMAVVNTKVKKEMRDPYMPDCVFGMIESIFDSIWPDIKNEVKSMILSGITNTPLYHGEPPCCAYSPLAVLRYHLLPYDRGFWRKIRSPIFVLFTLISIVPKYGISAIMFTFLFLIIDKSDEFQLQEFILGFKALQFVSMGIISATVGAAQYFICTTSEPMNCDEWAPREEVFTIALFVWQTILVWIAFLLLGCSQAKGGDFYHIKKLEGVKPEDLSLEHALIHENLLVANAVADDEARTVARRRLRNFLIYDLVIFVICAGLTAWLAFHFQLDPSASVTRHKDNVKIDNWKFTTGLYAIKTLFGMLSIPFVVLKIPGLSTIISHARPTGYNPYGNCVRYVGVEEDGPLPWAPDRPTKEQREKAEEEAEEREEREAKQRKAAESAASREPVV